VRFLAIFASEELNGFDYILYVQYVTALSLYVTIGVLRQGLEKTFWRSWKRPGNLCQ